MRQNPARPLRRWLTMIIDCLVVGAAEVTHDRVGGGVIQASHRLVEQQHGFAGNGERASPSGVRSSPDPPRRRLPRVSARPPRGGDTGQPWGVERMHQCSVPVLFAGMPTLAAGMCWVPIRLRNDQ